MHKHTQTLCRISTLAILLAWIVGQVYLHHHSFVHGLTQHTTQHTTGCDHASHCHSHDHAHHQHDSLSARNHEAGAGAGARGSDDEEACLACELVAGVKSSALPLLDLSEQLPFGTSWHNTACDDPNQLIAWQIWYAHARGPPRSI